MTRDEAVARIAFLLGNRSDLNDAIVRELKAAQTQLENGPLLPWFLLSEEATASIALGQERIAIPSDFLREPEEEGALWLFREGTAEPFELAKAQYDKARYVYTGSEQPKVYAAIGGYFYLFPVPDRAYTLKLIYFAADTSLSTNIENKWLKYAPDLLCGQAGGVLATVLEKASASALFAAMAAGARDAISRANTARLEANRVRRMGERP
jgi:hypothetical protein